MRYDSKLYAFAAAFDAHYTKMVLRYLEHKPGERVLEIGCRRGLLLRNMQKRGVEAEGIDVNKKAISVGVALKMQTMDATNLIFADNSFDKLYSLHTIEHILDLKKAFQEMGRVLKPGGRIVILYPAELIRGMLALWSGLMLWEHPRKIHVHKLTPKKIQEFIKDTKLQYVESHFSVFFGPQYLTVLKKRT